MPSGDAPSQLLLSETKSSQSVCSIQDDYSVVSKSVVDPGFTKGGGIKYWICCLYYHTFIKLTKPQGGRWSKIVLLQKDLFFF